MKQFITHPQSFPNPADGREGSNILGFTLVELIVVISIIAILGTIAFISFGSYSSTARDSVRIEELSNIQKGLVLYYPLEEQSGTGISDYSGFGNNGKVDYPTNTTFTGGKLGNGVYFEGNINSGSIVGINNINNFNQITSVFYLKKNTINQDWESPFHFIGPLWYHFMTDGKVMVRSKLEYILGRTPYNFYTNEYQNKVFNIKIYLEDGLWHMHSTTIGNGIYKYFIDGNLIYKTTINTNISNNGRIKLGFGNFKGTIDEVRIYNRALSDLEIQALYNATK